MAKKNIIICGGGTAGHIYPALSIAEKLKLSAPDFHIIFVGTTRELEKNIMEKHKTDFIPLKIEGLKGKGIKTIKSLFLLPYAFIKSLIILIKKQPVLVIGVGGYSSGPMVLMAAWMKKPTLIMEQNSIPGFTNKALIPWVTKAAVAFRSSLPYFKGKGMYTGNPVRKEFYKLVPKKREDRLSLLIFGGSQGSKFLNQGMTEALPFLLKYRNQLIVFHQTGQQDHSWVKNSYSERGFSQAVVEPYFFNMEEYFQRSDLIICRAGATTIAELIAAKKASLLIPFAQAADNHQYFNAQELEKSGGAEILTEHEFTAEKLVKKILYFLENQEKITQMEKNLSRLEPGDAADKIVGICLELMENNQGRN